MYRTYLSFLDYSIWITVFCLNFPEANLTLLFSTDQVLLENPERVAEVLQFLTGDLGLDGSDLRRLITRFPIVLSYGVQVRSAERVC